MGATTATPSVKQQNRIPVLLLLFAGGLLLLTVCVLISLKLGPAHVSWRTIWDALFTADATSKEQLYIRTLRLPRTLLAGIVGSLLALAGLLTQLATRNPLASPHVFGIHAGASLAVVAGLLLLPTVGLLTSAALAFTGAALGSALIWLLTGGGPRQPVLLALAGITIHLLFASITEGAMILQQYSTESMIFWLAGSVNHATWQHVLLLSPVLGLCALLLVLLLPALRMLELEDEVAAGLGAKPGSIRIIAMALVVLLAGSAVAFCGPIGFVCLIVPHIARGLLGPGCPLAALLALTALLGSILLVLADVLSRLIAFPFESPVGIVMALLGAPAFIYLARRQGARP